MAFLYMGFSCENDLEKSDSISPFGDGMIVISKYEQNGSHETEFWPIEHPIEPLDEDQPIKCPMLNSSVMNNGRMHDEHLSQNLRKRAEQSQKQRRVVVPAAEAPTRRTVRKRHHTHSSIDENVMSPFLRMPPRDQTIFDMLQQVDKV